MNAIVRFLMITVAAVLLHVGLGWEWTILAGVTAGFWFRRHAWAVGAVAVGLDWMILVLYSYAMDARAVGRMTDAVAGILGNMPAFAVVAITLLIGLLIGGFGGATGAQLKRVLRRRRASAAV